MNPCTSFARRHQQRMILALLALLLLAACGQSAIPPTASPTELNPVIAVSELVVGPNRLALGIIRNGTPANDPNLKVQLRIFDLILEKFH